MEKTKDRDIPEIIQKYLYSITDCDNILLIGPGESTTEIFFDYTNNTAVFQKLELDSKIPSKNCSNCPYRMLCSNGNPLKKGKLQYRKAIFDKVILRADACMLKDKMINDIKIILKYNGQLIFFTQKSNYTLENKTSNTFIFDTNQIMSNVNSSELEIESVTTLYDNSIKAMCVVTEKNHNML